MSLRGGNLTRLSLRDGNLTRLSLLDGSPIRLTGRRTGANLNLEQTLIVRSLHFRFHRRRWFAGLRLRLRNRDITKANPTEL